MKTIYMENRSSTGNVEHSKFYKIIDDGKKVTFQWGPTGSDGQSKIAVVSDNDQERSEVFEKQKALKLKNHYNVIRIDNDGDVTHVENRPSSAGRKWGLEIETHSNLDINLIAEKMRERGLQVNVELDRYFKSRGDMWDVKRDGSCGYEFASKIYSGDSGLFDAKIAVEKIREVCPSAVNQKCGIHVTVDIADHSPEDFKRLCVGYLKAQEHFFVECAEWRQHNQYCRRNCESTITSSLAGMNQTDNTGTILRFMDATNRYQGLNLARYTEKKIVEFRMMESSVSIRKVGSWIRLCVGFIDGLKKSGVRFKTTETFSPETFKAICEGTWRTHA